MSVFNISPSEAVLIGCCIGEYVEARQDTEYANVLHFFWKWLSPVVPNFEASTTAPITEDELPKDIAWRAIGNRTFAIDAEDTRLLYEKTTGGITRTHWDRPRSSLLDLLGDLVSHFVVKSPRDRLRFPSPEDHAEARLLEERVQTLVGAFENASLNLDIDSLEAIDGMRVNLASEYQTPELPDNMEAVLDVINHVMVKNATEDYFSIGKSFGETAATLERWERSLFEDPIFCYVPGAEYRGGKRMWSKDRVLSDEYRANVKRLLQARLVQECWHASAVLRVESDREALTEYDECDPLGGIRAGLCLAEARTAIWFSLGTLLGTLKDVDNAARERDRGSLTPRPYMLGSRASAEQIAGLIRMVEQTFGDLGDKNLQPEYLVNCLANAIEGLARGLWPMEFDQGGRKGELRNVLQAHCTTGSEAEIRFSRTALTLYDLYRKPVSHGLGVFRCTWEEARFFHAGIRTLHKLSEEIERSRAKPQRGADSQAHQTPASKGRAE
jgi:hypothetical protein